MTSLTKEVASISFSIEQHHYTSFKEILEAKYGPSQKSGGADFWYGDKNTGAMIHISKYAESSGLFGPVQPASISITIITAAMRKVRDRVEERRGREEKERKAKAINGL
jgi:hypothetical protein